MSAALFTLADAARAKRLLYDAGRVVFARSRNLTAPSHAKTVAGFSRSDKVAKHRNQRLGDCRCRDTPFALLKKRKKAWDAWTRKSLAMVDR